MSTATSRQYTLISGLLLLLLGLTFLRPIDTPEFWWHWARGDAVLAGNVCPSRTLLANETLNDADWLGGLGTVLAWEIGGALGVGLYPFCMGIALLALCRMNLLQFSFDLNLVVYCVLSLFAFSWMQPIPQSLELLLALSLFVWTQKALQSTPAVEVHLLITLVCWANLGANVLVAFSVCVVFVLLGTRTRAEKLKWAIGLLLVCSLTPRGVMTLWDSAHVVAPWLFHTPMEISGASTLPMDLTSLAWEETAFLLFATSQLVLGVTCLIDKRDYIVILFFTFLSVMNSGLIGLSATWMALQFATFLKNQTLKIRYFVVATSFVAVMSYHLVNQSMLGVVGLHPKLDYRLSQDNLPKQIDGEVAWCDSNLAGGMYCFVSGTGRCWDIPLRAMVGGRLNEMELFRRDLLRDRESRYRRPDGTWGGWWVATAERNIGVLLVESDDASLHRSLQSTEWKPTDLDASIVPYVQASNQSHQEAIINYLQTEEIVSYSPWTFNYQQFAASQPYIALHRSSGDFLSKQAAQTQAMLFDSLGMHVAALKVLLALRNEFNPVEFEQDVRQCHQGLAFQEWKAVGQNSVFHTQLGLIDYSGKQRADLLFDDQFESDYLAGNIANCMKRKASTSEEHFAQAMIALEAGNVTEAVTFWEAAVSGADPSDLSIQQLAQSWLNMFQEEVQ